MAEYGAVLLEDETGDATGEWKRWGGGTGFFQVTGTVDGVTVALQISRDDENTATEVASLSAVDVVAVDLPECDVRAVTTGSGASTDVTVRL